MTSRQSIFAAVATQLPLGIAAAHKRDGKCCDAPMWRRGNGMHARIRSNGVTRRRYRNYTEPFRLYNTAIGPIGDGYDQIVLYHHICHYDTRDTV